MVIAKKQLILLPFFLYLLVFPLGQLMRLELGQITLHSVDILAGIGGLIYVLKSGIPNFNRLTPFLLAATFSLLLSFELVGFLYLVRLFAYVLFYFYLKEIDKKILTSGLIATLLVFLILGLLQYVFLPDLRWLSTFGWDDHYYRLTSTILDPGFTGILLVFGALLSIRLGLIPVSILFVLATALTFSRASYIALLVALLYMRKKVGYFLIVFFLFLIPILPRPGGEGVNLTRRFSVDLRLENYKETINIWKRSPVFGVGFNNICFEKGRTQDNLHSCSGSDSSILLILVSTGLVGLFAFVWAVRLNPYIIALLVHSTFVNSLFYPWVMGILAILAASSWAKLKLD